VIQSDLAFFDLKCGAALALMALAGACGTGSGSTDAKGKKGDGQPRAVQVVPAAEGRITRVIEANGTLAAYESVALAMKVSGRISEMAVDLGDRVKQGQVVARLDPTDLRIAVEQATAALHQARTRLGLPVDGTDERVVPERTPSVRQAQASLNEAKLKRERAQQLYDQKLIAQSDFDSAQAVFQIAEGAYLDAIEEIRNRQAVLRQRRSELEMATQQLAYAVLTAPIGGAVADRTGSVGQYVAAGAPILTILNVNPLRLRIPVPERAATGVRLGQRVRLRLDERSQEHYGRVTRLAPAIDETNRTLLVEAEIPNERGELRPGAFVRAELLAEAPEPAIFVPTTALLTFAGIEKVITVEQGKSVEKIVRTGYREAGRVEITEGLKAGELVVARPGNLVGGRPVTILSK
jgi:RND family efflux transporter MFP subunit